MERPTKPEDRQKATIEAIEYRTACAANGSCVGLGTGALESIRIADIHEDQPASTARIGLSRAALCELFREVDAGTYDLQ